MVDFHRLGHLWPVLSVLAEIMLPWHLRRLALLVILPAIQITFFTATVGGDVKDVKLDYTNLDNSKYLVCTVKMH